MKKKLLALLLCLTMLLVMLPTVALADLETDPQNSVNATLNIIKTVRLSGTTTLPDETFEFEITAKDGKTLEESGVVQHDSLAISTSDLNEDGVGVYNGNKNFSFTFNIRTITGGGGNWTPNTNEPNETPTSYTKFFLLKEKSSSSEGWNNDTAVYDVKFTYNTDGTMSCNVWVQDTDGEWSSSGFVNAYTANNSSIVIIVPETTEAAPNPTTGAAPANLGLGCVVIGLAAMGAVAYARKK